MMFKRITFGFILFAAFRLSAQNLVPNSGFEQYSGCPIQYACFDSVLNWFNPTPTPWTGGSPDYFNSCATQWVDVPNNFAGHQNAHGGNAYAGIVLYYDSSVETNYREYIEVQLMNPLQTGYCYTFSMYVNAPDYDRYTADRLGVYFSDTLIGGIQHDSTLSFVPQITNALGMLNDSIQWMHYTGIYTASGGEEFIVIGNFNQDSTTGIAYFPSNYSPCAYVYTDDVSLMHCDSPLVINPVERTVSYMPFPNPASDHVTLSCSKNCGNPTSLLIYDSMGQLVRHLETRHNSLVTVTVSDFSNGIYFYQFVTEEAVVDQGRFEVLQE